MITTLTSRQFNQDASAAKRAARNGPVMITDRGRPAHVLLSIEEYHRLTGAGGSIVDRLAMPLEAAAIVDEGEGEGFEPPKMTLEPRPVDLS